MSWRVSGPLFVNRAVHATLTWENGKLIGTPEALAEIAVIESLGIVKVTPTGPLLKANRRNQAAAFLMAQEVIWHPDIGGEPPTITAPPSEGDEVG